MAIQEINFKEKQNEKTNKQIAQVYQQNQKIIYLKIGTFRTLGQLGSPTNFCRLRNPKTFELISNILFIWYRKYIKHIMMNLIEC